MELRLDLRYTCCDGEWTLIGDQGQVIVEWEQLQ